MQMLRAGRAKGVVIAMLLMLSLSGCIVVRDSPAPGCVKTIGFTAIGGCFGKTAIMDLEVKPELECLDVMVNNCNGGVLNVENNCDVVLMIDGIAYETENYIILDVIEEDDGTHSVIETYGNFSEYIPDADTRITVTGTLGSQEFTVSFTKTAQLCE